MEASGLSLEQPVATKTQPNIGIKDVLAHNEMRFKEFRKRPFFEMIRNLTDPDRRANFLNSLQVFSNYFQQVLIVRQATCADKTYAELFLEHMIDELGHNKLLEDRDNKKIVKDPILEAISSWFCYQMFILDNVEKAAIVHLVLETAAEYFVQTAVPVIGSHVYSGFFEIHNEADAEHAALGQKLLQNQHPVTYQKLITVIDDAWNVLTELTNRFVYLTEKLEKELI